MACSRERVAFEESWSRREFRLQDKSSMSHGLFNIMSKSQDALGMEFLAPERPPFNGGPADIAVLEDLESKIAAADVLLAKLREKDEELAATSRRRQDDESLSPRGLNFNDEGSDDGMSDDGAMEPDGSPDVLDDVVNQLKQHADRLLCVDYGLDKLLDRLKDSELDLDRELALKSGQERHNRSGNWDPQLVLSALP